MNSTRSGSFLIAGKHVRIQLPAHSGSIFRNYRCRFSVQMMAVVDTTYQLRYVSVDAQGRASDAGILAQLDLKGALDRGHLNIPSANPLPRSATEAPYMFLGDDAYPLHCDLTKSFPFLQMDHNQSTFELQTPPQSGGDWFWHSRQSVENIPHQNNAQP